MIPSLQDRLPLTKSPNNQSSLGRKSHSLVSLATSQSFLSDLALAHQLSSQRTSKPRALVSNSLLSHSLLLVLTQNPTCQEEGTHRLLAHYNITDPYSQDMISLLFPLRQDRNFPLQFPSRNLTMEDHVHAETAWEAFRHSRSTTWRLLPTRCLHSTSIHLNTTGISHLLLSVILLTVASQWEACNSIHLMVFMFPFLQARMPHSHLRLKQMHLLAEGEVLVVKTREANSCRIFDTSSTSLRRLTIHQRNFHDWEI